MTGVTFAAGREMSPPTVPRRLASGRSRRLFIYLTFFFCCKNITEFTTLSGAGIVIKHALLSTTRRQQMFESVLVKYLTHEFVVSARMESLLTLRLRKNSQVKHGNLIKSGGATA